jgi:hypothetical protein
MHRPVRLHEFREISNGSVIGQLASPNAVAVSSTRLVASPARCLEMSSSAAVPKAMTTALCSTPEASRRLSSQIRKSPDSPERFSDEPLVLGFVALFTVTQSSADRTSLWGTAT